MGATGVALVVFAPDNDVITTLNWAWPPVMLALSVWMFVQMRRNLTVGGRWLLTPVIAGLALASVGATYANLTRRRPHLRRPRQELPGQRPSTAP